MLFANRVNAVSEELKPSPSSLGPTARFCHTASFVFSMGRLDPTQVLPLDFEQRLLLTGLLGHTTTLS